MQAKDSSMVRLHTCEVQTLLKETKTAVCRKQQNGRSEWKAHEATNSRMSCGRKAARPSHWLHLLSAPTKLTLKATSPPSHAHYLLTQRGTVNTGCTYLQWGRAYRSMERSCVWCLFWSDGTNRFHEETPNHTWQYRRGVTRFEHSHSKLLRMSVYLQNTVARQILSQIKNTLIRHAKHLAPWF